ncbi:MAG: hypothetical protein Q8P24_02245 [Desulfobacterales bacterium]|nr:hypothetical protein [Desulfobacterales bacterium]
MRNGNKEMITADTIVLSQGMTPRKELAAALQGNVKGLYIVGDCLEPRRMIHAIWEGFHAARSL